jgi:cyclopropane-fatty-acyl-phospholipid synthase
MTPISTSRTEQWLERGVLPDWLIRRGIRSLLRQRLTVEHAADAERSCERLQAWLDQCRHSPIAVETSAANEQHYEVPAAFYAQVLGKYRKYSSGLWTPGVQDLDAAEAAMLELATARAEIRDGMRILDLGCGWGSMSLWLAQRFRNCQIVGVSNSNSQRADILQRARQAGLTNVEILTADANTFQAPGEFDRVVSVEMMEHTRNWPALLERIASWLRRDGKMFLHIFTHRTVGYPFATDGDNDWMARFFFTGGQMPADHQILYWQDHMAIDAHWRVNGCHYQKTAEAWLQNFDRNRSSLEPILREAYGERSMAMANLWRVFFMACAELWGYAGGQEWFVSHYRLRKR